LNLDGGATTINGNNAITLFPNNGSNLNIKLDGLSDFVVDTNKLVVLDSGNVGIKDETPDALLDINGAMMAVTMVNKSLYNVISATNVTVNWNNGNKQKITLGHNVTFTFTNPSNGVGSFTLILKQDSVGSRTVTWPASVKWPGGTAPVISTAPNKTDVITCIYDGSDYLCQIGIDFF
jgi:hypothetical protein